MKNHFVMLIGLPASGKSTLSDEYKEMGYIVHSSDALRVELYGDLKGLNSTVNIFDELHKRIIKDLLSGNDVVYDATNLVSKRRKAFLQQISKIDCRKTAMVRATPYNVCLDRDKARENKVGATVLEKMYKSFQVPCKQEGFDNIMIKYSGIEYISRNDEIEKFMKLFEFLNTIHQNNSNHTETVGGHCIKVSKQLDMDKDFNLYTAGILHDIGKPFTASFKDSHGKMSNECHYYSHESISAYDSMFYLIYRSIESVFDTALLINYHMLPHRLKEEKTINKYKNFLGIEFWNRLIQLHEADKGGR